MKHEWRKKEKEFYLPKTTPEIKEIPEFKFCVLEGEGNHNGEQFSKCIEALYAISYGIRMLNKAPTQPEGYFEYTVYPLEGYWSLNEEGFKRYKGSADLVDLKDFFKYKIMIKQPDFVTDELLNEIKEKVFKKKNIELVKEAKLVSIKEGLVSQIMHIGPYDDEPATFKIMEDYIDELGYERITKDHREIYISDPRKVDPSKMKTVLRIEIKEKGN